jgi:Uma2 family endonuclease
MLNAHVKQRGLGEILLSPVDVILSDRTVVQPDLVYVDPTRAGLVTERAIEGPPTLVVEVISPSTVTIDRVMKPRLYARYAVPYLWLVDAEARVLEAFVLERGEYWLAMRATGTTPAGVPPFAHVALVPASLWPWSPISRPEPAPSRCAPARNNP